ncbi:MAG: ATP synthase F1 subunit gamma [Candidatus Paceibacterota bacterium]|jgi:F-type H+-transporting ATPase subunit gamma
MKSKEIKQKIGSVQNIAKITNAMGLVSAVKMGKAQNLALNSRPFALRVYQILKKLSHHQKKEGLGSFYFKEREIKKVLAVVVSSDRGFCGPFNKNLLNFAQKKIKALEGSAEVEIMAIGKKSAAFFKNKGYKVRFEFSGIGDFGELNDMRPIADLLIRHFESDYQQVLLFFTNFVTTLNQEPWTIQILPVKEDVFEKMLKEHAPKASKEMEPEPYLEYVFEPNTKDIFDSLVPELVTFEIYHSILEANASEHSARMIAMKNASDNAKEVIKMLILDYNKARQEQITSELGEITSAKEAIS